MTGEDSPRSPLITASRWMAVVLYCAAIFIQSANPAPERLPVLPGLDKVLHFGGYALLGLLFCRAYETTPLAGSRPLTLAVTGALSAAFYGLTDEIHQAFVPQRCAQALDLVADALGGAAGAAFWLWKKAARGRFVADSRH